ncbi:MAG: right-handed parallel beta-helix repeat-containing protein [Armatimonadia bacterium]
MFSLLPFCHLAHATGVSGVIATGTTWTAAGSPYVLQGDVTISAGVTLTLEPGVRVVANGDYRVFVNGTLSGAATVAAPIVLEAADPAARGAWQGLYVPAGGRCVLTNATVRNAVYDIVAPGGEVTLTDCEVGMAAEHGLYAWNATRVNAVGCRFADSGMRGIYIEGYQASGEIRNCQFYRNGDYPLYVKATVAEIIGGGNLYKGNGVQRVGVSCSMLEDITDTDVWTRQQVPFELGAGTGDGILKITAAGALSIPAGTQIVAKGIDCLGDLRVIGEEGARVLFEGPGTTPAAGAWAGIVLRAGASGDFRFVDMAHATTALTVDEPQSLFVSDCTFTDSQYDGVSITGNGPVTVRRSVFARNGRNGLRLAGTGLTGYVDVCTFTNNTSYPVWSFARNVRMLKVRNAYSGNGVSSIGVSCDFEEDVSGGVHDWYPQGLPLDLTAGTRESVLAVSAAATLNIHGEQTIYSGGVVVYGKLYVAADGSKPCRFLGTGVGGAWNGISFDGGAGELRGAVVEGASTGVTLMNSSPLIYECLLQRCQQDGLRCRGTSSPVVADTVIAGNGRHGVLIEGTATPNLGCLDNADESDDGGNYLHGNAGYEVYNDTAGGIEAEGNAWASTSTAGINARIFDRLDLSSLGIVDFSPVWAAGPNRQPVLSWPGVAGYSDNGLNPEMAETGSAVEFRVRYADVEGQAPAFVRVHVACGGVEIEGSPLLMTESEGSDYAAGVVYAASWLLPGGRGYTYWFSASDGRDAATGTPCIAQPGPQVTTRPTLQWAGSPGYTTDAVSPDAAVSGTTFQFRVKYSDPDGDAPVRVACHVRRDGVPVVGSPFWMGPISGTGFVTGKVYRTTRTLTEAGTYSYRFEATDGLLSATGTPTAWRTGPAVAAGAAGLLAVQAEQLHSGLVQLSWHQGQAGLVRAEVANLAGRLVACPIEQRQYGAGQQMLLWAARGQGGQRVPPGRYLIRLRLDDEQGGRHTALIALSLR